MGVPTEHPAPLVSLRSVSLNMGLKRVLDGVALDIMPGDVVGLIGPGGCGKTILTKVLASLLVPLRGQVEIFGQRLQMHRSGALHSVRRAIGMQFQNFALFDSLTVLENVCYPMMRRLSRDQADQARKIRAVSRELLREVGLGGTEDQHPGDLSGGMKRRVAVARALISRPRLALFDDPTAGLDPVNSARILGLITERAADSERAVVMAGHDLDRLFPRVNRLILMRDGRIAFDGDLARGTRHQDPWVREFLSQEAAVHA